MSVITLAQKEAVNSQVLAFFVDNIDRPRHLHQFINYRGSSSLYSVPLPTIDLEPNVGIRDQGAGTVSNISTPRTLVANLSYGYKPVIFYDELRQILGGNNLLLRDKSIRTMNQGMNETDGSCYESLLLGAQLAGNFNAADFDGGNVFTEVAANFNRTVFHEAEGSFQRDGNHRTEWMYAASPLGYSRVLDVYGDQIRTTIESPMMGVNADVRVLNGIPILPFDSIPNVFSVQAVSSAIAGNELTATFDRPHPYQVGMNVRTEGGSANITTPTPVTAATLTTVTADLTSAANPTNGALTMIGTDGAPLFLINREKFYFLGDLTPESETVDGRAPGSVEVRVYGLFGREMFPSYTVMFQVPRRLAA